MATPSLAVLAGFASTALHGFYVVSTATMLVWFLRYGMRTSTHRVTPRLHILADAHHAPGLLASLASDRQEA
jgi:hypothetical protein